MLHLGIENANGVKFMPKRKRSILHIFGWGLLGDVILLTMALAITAIFAVSSFSMAYIIAFTVLVLLLSALYIFNRIRRKNI